MVYLNDDIAHFDWEAALPLLSEQRREQTLKFKHLLGRSQFLNMENMANRLS